MKEYVLRSVWHKAGFHNIISSGVPIIEDLSQMLQPQESSLPTRI